MADGYEDEITAEEQAALDAHLKDPALPPPDDAEGADALAAAAAEAGVAPAPPAAAPAAPAPPAAPADPAPPAATAAPDPEFASFFEKNKDKTPEELAQLAFNASKRANREGFTARKSRSPEAAQKLADTKADVERRRQAFKDDLAADPDAATLRLHEERLDAEVARAEEEAHSARIDDAIEFAGTYIPDFQTTAPQVFSFGEEMGYTREEVQAITDGRDLVTLNLARLAGNLIKGGVIDIRGNFLKAPEPIAATDPRLTAPEPVKTHSSAPARPADGGNTVEAQLQNMANMSDADFDKLDPAQLENLQRQAMGG